MSNIVNLESLQRLRKAVRDGVPEGGAVILLFTGIQYVRDEADIRMYEGMARQRLLNAEHDCQRQPKNLRSRKKVATKH